MSPAITLGRWLVAATFATGTPALAVPCLVTATTNALVFNGTLKDPCNLAVRAYVWGFPLVEAARIRNGRQVYPKLRVHQTRSSSDKSFGRATGKEV